MDDPLRVLIVEDDESVLDILAERARRWGYEVLEAPTLARAITVAQKYAQEHDEIHVLVSALELEGAETAENSLAALEPLRAAHPEALLLVTSARFGPDIPEDLTEPFERHRVHDVFGKPVRLRWLRLTLRRAEAHVRLRLERDRLRALLLEDREKLQEQAKRAERQQRDLRRRLYRALLRLETEAWANERVVEGALRLIATRELGELLKVAVDVIQEIVPSEATVVFYREARNGHREEDLSSLIHRIHVRGGELDESSLEPICMSLAQEVASTGQVLAWPGRPDRGSPDLDLGDELRSVLALPLVGQSEGVLGVVILCNRIGGRGRVRELGFSASDEKILLLISSFLAQGILSYYEVGFDPLTLLPNRRALDRRFPRELDKVRRRRDDRETWFAIADIDHFGMYNSICGHLVGDTVLQTVARTLERSVRDFVARWGGEEFTIILTQIESEEQAREVLERARETIALIPVPQAEKMPFRSITVTIGATRLCPQDTLQDTFERANEVLRESKGQGRNRIGFASSPCDPPAKRRRRRKEPEPPTEEGEEA